ncbi:hypothetical protein QFZ80_004594 [Paenibacillus sp. V4I7]|nr:hypothetical protein [Paenibacillus sp. V4I7]
MRGKQRMREAVSDKNKKNKVAENAALFFFV